jgi:hypothetical protein
MLSNFARLATEAVPQTIGGFWRSLQHEFGELLGGVGEGEALAGGGR